MNLTDLITKIATIAPAFDAFVARYWLRFVLVGALITGAVTLRTCLEAGRSSRAMHNRPDLTPKETRVMKREDKQLVAQSAHLEYQRDSVVAKVKVNDRHLARTEHQTDSLTLLYDKVPTAVAHATDDELFSILSAYRPGAFPDTTNQ